MKEAVTFTESQLRANRQKPLSAFCKLPCDRRSLMHKRLGNSISIWKDGKVVIVPPEEIVISPEVLRIRRIVLDKPAGASPPS